MLYILFILFIYFYIYIFSKLEEAICWLKDDSQTAHLILLQFNDTVLAGSLILSVNISFILWAVTFGMFQSPPRVLHSNFRGDVSCKRDRTLLSESYFHRLLIYLFDFVSFSSFLFRGLFYMLPVFPLHNLQWQDD
jgi:hypothetical protein